MTTIEWVAFLLGILYLMGISMSQRWAWLFGIGNALLYVYLSLESQLYVQSILQSLYVIFGVYGFWAWGKEIHATVKEWRLKKQAVALVVFSIFSLMMGGLLAVFSDQKMPYIDSFIAVFALLATYQTAHHILENWYYWIVINAASVFLFYAQELRITAALFFVNLLISIWGVYQWKKQMKAAP